MVTLGRIALRNFAMVRQGYSWIDHEGNARLITDGFVGPEITVFPDALSILKDIHKLPESAPYMPTGMLVPFTPDIGTFEPGDEDVGSYADAFDQTILSRLAGMRFSTDGMSYEDMQELCRCFGVAYEFAGLPDSSGKFYTASPVLAIPGDFAITAGTGYTTIRQQVGVTDGFQSWSFLWQDGMEQAEFPHRRIYIMPFAFVSGMRITAGLRSEIGVAVSCIAREVVEVANVRDWVLRANLETNEFYDENYPLDGAGLFVRPVGDTSEDIGITSHVDLADPNNPVYLESVRNVKHRFTSPNIEIYLDNGTALRGLSDNPTAAMAIDSDVVGMTLDLSTGLNPSWRFGDLAFRQTIRIRRGMNLSLSFVNDTRGRAQFRRFLAARRKVQKIWIVFYDPEHTRQMVIEAYIRLANVGDLPSDDGQGADVFPLMYRSVGVRQNTAAPFQEIYLTRNESDFAIHFGVGS